MANQPSRRTLLVLAGLLIIVGLCVGIGVETAFFLRGLGRGGQGLQGNSSDQTSTKSQEIREPLLRMFADGLPESRDVDKSERDQALSILREADPLLARVKAENRRALDSLKQESRVPNRPAAQDKPAAKDGRY